MNAACRGLCLADPLGCGRYVILIHCVSVNDKVFRILVDSAQADRQFAGGFEGLKPHALDRLAGVRAGLFCYQISHNWKWGAYPAPPGLFIIFLKIFEYSYDYSVFVT